MKNKRIVNIIDTYIGLGDVLFFAVMAAAFSPINFIVFYLVSTVLTLISFLVYTFVKKQPGEIPLAGAMSIGMLLLMLLNAFMPSLNFYNDDFFISCLAR